MPLTAKIRTRDGWAVSHAVVTLTDMTGTQVLRAEANDDGAVHDTTVLVPGAYTAIVTAVGYAPAAATAFVTASGRAEIGAVTLARQGGSELPPPGVWSIDPVHSSITAVAQHLGFASIRGRFDEFAGRIEIAPDDVARSRVEAVITTASIDTGNRLRDDHLRTADFLGAEEHPHITYRSTGLTAAGSDRWTVHGELTLNGVVRPVDLDLSYLGTGPDSYGAVRAAFRATAELRRDDFAMKYNEILQAGIAAVGTTLKVELDIQAVQGETHPSA